MDLSTIDMNEVLHALRTAQLGRSRAGGPSVLLSAGCSGRWYFDWVADHFGPVDHHIGVEYYSPEPDDLPGNVTWIANTVGRMEAVDDASVDVVFSGQNIEHLWPADMVGFMLEANRVLRPGGRLIMDSPNRAVTQRLRWTHPEHIIELTPDEMTELAGAAGFEVDTLVGLWDCHDGGGPVAFAPADEAAMARRALSGLDHPDTSFIWWAEAERTGPADVDRLTRAVDRIGRLAWHDRTQRLVPLTGELNADETAIMVPAGTPGIMFFGPYVPLPAGRYRARFEVTVLDRAGKPPAWCDVTAAGRELGRAAVHGGLVDLPQLVEVPFELDELTFGVEFRLTADGTAGIDAALGVELVTEGQSPLAVPLS
ncbi:MAG: methyltransferase domain-containing protein [Acidimicrobiales bacterium]